MTTSDRIPPAPFNLEILDVPTDQLDLVGLRNAALRAMDRYQQMEKQIERLQAAVNGAEEDLSDMLEQNAELRESRDRWSTLAVAYEETIDEYEIQPRAYLSAVKWIRNRHAEIMKTGR